MALTANGSVASSAATSGRGRTSESQASAASQAKSAISTAARNSGRSPANGSTT